VLSIRGQHRQGGNPHWFNHQGGWHLRALGGVGMLVILVPPFLVCLCVRQHPCNNNPFQFDTTDFAEPCLLRLTFKRISHCFQWLAHRRVPKKIWLGLPDPEVCHEPLHFEQALRGMSQVLLSGLDEIFNLAEERKTLFVRHVMKKTNWADLGQACKVQESAGRCACTDALSKRSLLDSGPRLERAGPSKKRSRIQSKEMGAILCCHCVPTLLHFADAHRESKRATCLL